MSEPKDKKETIGEPIPDVYQKMMDEGHCAKIFKGMTEEQRKAAENIAIPVIRIYEEAFRRIAENINSEKDLDYLGQVMTDIVKKVPTPTKGT